MSKKIIGLLLVLCMVVGLLPVVALADASDGVASFQLGSRTYKTTGFDKPVYIKSIAKEYTDVGGSSFTGYIPSAGSADDWNAKWEWKSGDKGPTLTLKGFKYDEWNDETKKMAALWDSVNECWSTNAMQTYSLTLPKALPEATIILTGEDSLLNCSFGITYQCNLTIKSEGNAKLTIDSPRSGITSNGKKGATLTLDANLDVAVRGYYNGDFSHMIQTTDADLTINGGNIKARAYDDAGFLLGIAARGSSGNVIINGGKIDVNSSVGTSQSNGTISAMGKIIVNGGDVLAQPKKAVGLYAKGNIEINGGKVKIISPYYAANAGVKDAPAEIQLNGGTLEIMAEKAFWESPTIKIGSKVEAYAGANRDNCELYDPTVSQMRYKPWFLASDTERIEITEPEEEELPSFSIPVASTPAGTTAPTTPAATTGADGTTAPTTATADKDDGGSNTTVLLIVAIAIVVIAGAAVAVIVIKRKKAK